MKLSELIQPSFDALCMKVGTANMWGGEVTVEAADLRLVLNYIKDVLCKLPDTPSEEICAIEAIAKIVSGIAGIKALHTAIERGGFNDKGKYRLPMVAK